MSYSPLRHLRQLGPLRLLLLLAGLATVLLRRAADAPVSLEGWAFVTTVVVPVVAPIVLVLLLLDALMARVFLSAAEEPALRARLRTVLYTNLAGATVLLVVWTPFMLALRQP
ncbi:MAG: hypothetical protein LPK58_00600 [Gammaproteobacteria bacterium]|nr:hypothetical protein [Gammaproteobacteria bacterium]MDX5374268.1 hypothetical protein [Gammaproteobacteria bacterium]